MNPPPLKTMFNNLCPNTFSGMIALNSDLFARVHQLFVVPYSLTRKVSHFHFTMITPCITRATGTIVSTELLWLVSVL